MSDEKPMGQVIQIDEAPDTQTILARDGSWNGGGDAERDAGC